MGVEKREDKLKADQVLFKKLGCPQTDEQEYPDSKTDFSPNGLFENRHSLSFGLRKNAINPVAPFIHNPHKTQAVQYRSLFGDVKGLRVWRTPNGADLA
jgi:hypothetical protein